MRPLVPDGLTIALMLVCFAACDETDPGPSLAGSIESNDIESLVAPTLGAATMVEALVQPLAGLRTDVVVVTALEGDVAVTYVVMPDGERRDLGEVMAEERLARTLRGLHAGARGPGGIDADQ